MWTLALFMTAMNEKYSTTGRSSKMRSSGLTLKCRIDGPHT
jgi:hypothetical protein